MQWLKLMATMATLAVVAIWVTEQNAGEAGLAAATWQIGALMGFLLIGSWVHDRFDVCSNKQLSGTWVLVVIVGIAAMAYVTFVEEGPGLLADLRLVGSSLLDRVLGLIQ